MTDIINYKSLTSGKSLSVSRKISLHTTTVDHILEFPLNKTKEGSWEYCRSLSPATYERIKIWNEKIQNVSHDPIFKSSINYSTTFPRP